ncbi:AAA family ATPase [Streptomyces sp. NPDC054849]
MSVFWPELPDDDCSATGPHSGPHLRRGELIGHGAEMEQIATALTAARSGRGGALFLTGEPGVGKTRLADEALATAAAADMVTVRGRAGAVGPPGPYRPLVEALLLPARADLLPDPDRLGRCGPVLTQLLSDTSDPGARAASHLMVAETVLRLLTAVAGEHGCLLVLDDLHDADAGTLAVVEYLLDGIGHQPVVLLLIARRAPCEATELAARGRRRGAATVVDLRPLSRPDVHLLVAAEPGIAPAEVCPELVPRAVDASYGSPFVVGEHVHDHTTGRTAPHDTRAPSVPLCPDRYETCGSCGCRWSG